MSKLIRYTLFAAVLGFYTLLQHSSVTVKELFRMVGLG